MIKLSIIVPVYNVEQYLHKCVDSLLSQDISDYEIILVDDGSTDGSGAICDSYVSIDDRCIDNRCIIKVIHRENGGLSAARNTGIAAAKGEYICFVDSDDYWEENVLGGLMEQVKTEELDVLRFDYQNVNAQYEVFEPNKTQRYIDKGTEVVDGITYLNTRMGYACYAVMYLMRKSIVPNFTEGMHFEDVDWLPRMMMRAKRVNSTTKMVYNYLVRQGSITKTQGNKTKIRKNVEDQMTVIEKYTKLISEFPQCTWLGRMQSSIVVSMLTNIAQTFYRERNNYIRRVREMKVFPLIIADQGSTYVRRARLLNLVGENIYCLIMRLR